MTRQTYIVATSKEWHQEGFKKISAEVDARWLFVRTAMELEDALTTSSPRYIFFLHWNWRVSEPVWRQYECVCFHMTDVPYGRGGSPLQNLVVAGHDRTQLSALQMVEEMDAGPVYTKRPLSLAGRAEDIYQRAGVLSFEIIRWMVQAEPVPTPQKGVVVKFLRRKPVQSVLPRSGTMKELYDHIRMLDAPTYPLAYLEYGDFVLELSQAELQDNELHAQVRIRKRTT